MSGDDKFYFRFYMAHDYGQCVFVIKGDENDEDELALFPMEIGG